MLLFVFISGKSPVFCGKFFRRECEPPRNRTSNRLIKSPDLLPDSSTDKSRIALNIWKTIRILWRKFCQLLISIIIYVGKKLVNVLRKIS